MAHVSCSQPGGGTGPCLRGPLVVCREDEATARQAGLDPTHPDARTQQLYRDLSSGAETGKCWEPGESGEPGEGGLQA